MKSAETTLIIFLVLLGLSFSVDSVEANQVRCITIQSDGSVMPETDFIRQEGNTYYLTQNLSKARLVINCSNIVFDGLGHLIDGAGWFVLGGKGISLENLNNVTIRDVTVIGYYEEAIDITSCSDITITSVKTDASGKLAIDIRDCIWVKESNQITITNSVTGVRLHSSYNCKIYNNNITLSIQSSNNLIYCNNIRVEYSYYDNKSIRFQYGIIGGGSVNSWDNGTVGNFWSDYSGKGDYVIDENNTDYYPLKQPITIQTILTPTTTPSVPELSWLIIVPLLISVFFVALIVRHRKSRSPPYEFR
jgi:hypothetical protein